MSALWNKKTWNLASVSPPWESGKSIWAHIRDHIVPGKRGLTDGGEELPDQKDDGSPKWVAGGLDGAFGHHGGGGGEESRAKMIHRSLRVVTEDLTSAKLKKLYVQMVEAGAIDCIDPLLERLVQKQDVNADRLAEFAQWLAHNAPDREPVKFAIALLGVIPRVDGTHTFLTLGRHEEFTLYAAVALGNGSASEVERWLFDLAQHVNGWGRIQLVERLAGTGDPEIKDWMLREGYDNSVMHEYLAYTCATSGGLRQALESDRIDPEILAGAGDIIAALMAGGPAQDIDDYADGADVHSWC